MSTSGPVFATTASGATSAGVNWSNTTNATGSNNSTFAAWANISRSSTGTLTLSGYSFSGVASSSIINSVSATIWNNVTSTSIVTAATAQLQDSSGTNIGAAVTLTRSTTSGNSQTITFPTNPTAAQVVGGLKIALAYTRSNSTSAGTANVDAASITVTYIPSPSDAYGAAVFADTPAAWYRLDGDYTDVLGGNTGTPTGSPSFGTALVNPDSYSGAQGITLNGSTQTVTMANDTALNPTGPFSIECWVNLAGAGSNDDGYTVLCGKLNWGLAVQISSMTPQFVGNSAYSVAASGSTLSLATTYHLVGVYNGTTLTIYVNGVAGTPFTGTVTTDSGSFTLGDYPSGKDFVNGTIDEVAVYNYALTSTQVTSHYTAGLSGTGYSQTPSDALGSTDSVTLAVGRNPADALGLTDAVTLALGRTQSDPLGSSDTAALAVGRNPTDALGLTDSVTTSRSAGDAYGTVIAADTPTAWFRLDGNATDAVGGAAGVVHGGVTWGTALVNPDSYSSAGGAVLDGSTGYIQIANRAEVAPTGGAWSLECWWKPTAFGSNADGYNVLVGTSLWEIQVTDVDKNVGSYVNGSGPAGDLTYAYGSLHHLVLTSTGTSAVLYVNGVAGAAKTVTTFADASDFFIGAYNNGGSPNDFTTATIDEVAVYNYALTSTQVSAHYSAGLGATSYSQTPSDALGFTDTANIALGRTQSDPLGLTDTVTMAQDVDRPVADLAGLTDGTTLLTVGRNPADSLGLTDAVAMARETTVADQAGLTDAATAVQDAARPLADSLGLTDMASADVDYAWVDAVAWVDASPWPGPDLGGTETPSDLLGLTDTVTTARGTATPDPLGLTDTVTMAQDVDRPVADLAGLTDAATPVQDATRSTPDALALTDATSSVRAVDRPVADAVGLTDAATAVRGTAQSAADPAGLTDAATTAADVARRAHDSAELSDAVTCNLAPALIADPVGITDQVGAVLTNGRNIRVVFGRPGCRSLNIGRITTRTVGSGAFATRALNPGGVTV